MKIIVGTVHGTGAMTFDGCSGYSIDDQGRLRVLVEANKMPLAVFEKGIWESVISRDEPARQVKAA